MMDGLTRVVGLTPRPLIMKSVVAVVTMLWCLTRANDFDSRFIQHQVHEANPLHIISPAGPGTIKACTAVQYLVQELLPV